MKPLGWFLVVLGVANLMLGVHMVSIGASEFDIAIQFLVAAACGVAAYISRVEAEVFDR